MNVEGKHYRTIWLGDDGCSVGIIDQTRLPGEFAVLRLTSLEHVATAIRTMQVRGAPLIGVAAAYGMALATQEDPSDAALDRARETLLATRPTAVNLRWALDRVHGILTRTSLPERREAAFRTAAEMADEDVAICEQIGSFAERILSRLAEQTGGPVEVLTHCNAGWLATVDWGTALSGVYRAHDAGIPVHVWVDETRPRNQGYLTAWELGRHGVPHTVVVDNAGGLLMHQGKVDVCLVGTDRTLRSGDVTNKIGTYLKALAAKDTGVPFYVAAPSTSIDWTAKDPKDIPIEERDRKEVAADPTVPVHNPGFDITPARLVTGIITERGVCEASEEGLLTLFPERR